MDIKRFQNWIAQIKGEISRAPLGDFVLVTPKEIPAAEVTNNVPPEMGRVKVVVGVKPSTFKALEAAMQKLAANSGVQGRICTVEENAPRSIVLTPCEGLQDPDLAWDEVCRILEADGYLDSWRMGGLVFSRTAAEAYRSNRKAARAVDEIDCALLSKKLAKARTIDDILALI